MKEECIYAIQINELSYSGLEIMDVKIGKTANLSNTISQYQRSSRNIKLLDTWIPNGDLSLSDCERGVHKIAEKFAQERESEKFIFLQDSYSKFSETVKLLLASGQSLSPKRSKNHITKPNKIKYSGNKPRSIILFSHTYPVSSWRDVIKIVASTLYKKHGNLDRAFSLKGAKNKYFSKNPKELKGPRPIPGTKIYFMAWASANLLMKMTHQLLQLYGHDTSDLEIEY